MPPTAPQPRRGAFTFVELLLALALGALAVFSIGLLLRTLLVSGTHQAQRLRGPFAAQAALRALSRELACAFPPPDADLVPLRIATSTEPGKPELRIEFYLPLFDQPAFPDAYDVHAVAYEVRSLGNGRRELLRISAPCAGPFADSPSTNLLHSGRFALAVEAVADDVAHDQWPPPGDAPPTLPSSLRFELAVDPGSPPRRAEVLLHAATTIRSPLDRPPPPDASPD